MSFYKIFFFSEIHKLQDFFKEIDKKIISIEMNQREKTYKVFYKKEIDTSFNVIKNLRGATE